MTDYLSADTLRPVLDGAACGVAAIRKATTSDITDIVEIERARFGDDAAGRERWRYLALKAKARTFVATVNSEIVGFINILIRQQDARARIYYLAIKQNASRRGIATALLCAAISDAYEGGCRRFVLETRADAAAANRFYEKHGFQRIGAVPFYYRDGVTAIKWRKDLQ